MPLPALLASLAPSLIGAAGSALGSYFGSRGQQPKLPQSKPSNFGGMQLQQVPGGGTMFQSPRYTGGQENALNQLLQQGLQGIQNQPNFGAIEEQARKGFSERTIPGIAERFTAMGGQRSSAFPQLLGSAAAGLETDLAGQRAQFDMNRQNQLMQLLQMGLQPQFDQNFVPGQESALGQFGGQALGGLAGSALPLLLQFLMNRSSGGQ